LFRQKTISISEPYPLSASVTVSNPTCIGISNGEIEVTVIGGTAPYYFTYNQNVVDFHVLTDFPKEFTMLQLQMLTTVSMK
jgi:hypothetical protein